MLPPLDRLPGVESILDGMGYFVLHAPRQVGKSTSMQALASHLTDQGRFASALLTVETGAPYPDDVRTASEAILGRWRALTRAQLPPELQPPAWPEAAEGELLAAALTAWAESCPRPLVLLLDEIDALAGQTLVAVLRQVRAGYSTRPTHLPWSVALIGMRDVRDYKISSQPLERSGSASPFNIEVESLTLRNLWKEGASLGRSFRIRPRRSGPRMLNGPKRCSSSAAISIWTPSPNGYGSLEYAAS